MRECTNAGMHECRNAGMQECRNARMHECGNAGMRECGMQKAGDTHVPSCLLALLPDVPDASPLLHSCAIAFLRYRIRALTRFFTSSAPDARSQRSGCRPMAGS